MSCKRTLLLWLIFLGYLPTHVFAAFTEVQLRLPQYSVIDALQDKDGYLWLATGTGLARYDGYTIKVYLQQVDDPLSLPANLVTVLFEDQQGSLWVGTANGVARFNKEMDYFKRYLTKVGATESDYNASNVLYQTSNGVLLAGGRNGVFRYDPVTDNFIEVTYQNNPFTGIWKIAEQQGQVWIASESGLAVLSADFQLSLLQSEPVQDWILEGDNLWLSSGSWQLPLVYNLSTDVAAPWPDLRRFFRDASDQAWVYGEAGLAKLLPNGGLSWQYTDMEVFHMLETSAGELLIGGNRGVYKLNKATSSWQAMPMLMLNQQNPVDRLFETRDGTVFAVHGQGGLARWVPTAEKFAHYAPPLLQAFDSRGNNVVRHVYEQLSDNATTLWLSTRAVAKKLTLTADNNSIAKTELFELPVDDNSYVDFHAIQPLANQQLLVATAKGLYWLNEDTGSYTFADLNTLLPLNNTKQALTAHAEVFQFYKDDQCLWLLTNAGLGCASLDGMSIQRWFNSLAYPAFGNHRLYSAYRANDGALWLSGTGGVSRFDPTDFSLQHFSHDPENTNSLAHNWVHGVWQTAIDTYWIATREGGLNKLIWHKDRPAQWQRFGRKDGLPSEVIYGILGDKSGWLWLSTSQGIVRMHSETYEIRAYQPEDGVQSDEFNFSVMHQGQSGRFYFGGINGVNGFKPTEVVDNTIAPIVQLVGWAIHDKGTPLNNSLDTPLYLAYNENHLSFDYVGLHFADPSRIQYQYRLAGADTGWITAGTDKNARYGALKPGSYHFWVKAANPDGVWGEPVLLKSFVIKPHPLLSPWAWVCYVLMVLALLWVYKRLRDSTEQRLRHKVAEGVAREAALSHHLRVQFEHTIHEMRTPLMRLATHAERNIKAVNALPNSPQTTAIGQSLNAMLQAQQELQLLVENQQKLEELKLQYEHEPMAVAARVAILSECCRLQHYATEKHMVLNWQLEDIYLLLVPGVLELITAHLVGNSIKYCPPGSAITVSLSVQADKALLQVKDNGIGIQPVDLANIFVRHYRGAGAENLPGKGEGLFLVKTCVDNAAGKIEVESTVNQGCCFNVYLPLASTVVEANTASSMTIAQYIADELPAVIPEVMQPQKAEIEEASRVETNMLFDIAVSKSFKVLLVEDNDGLRADLAALLSCHYHCVAASSAMEGLALAKQYLPDVILSDVMMEKRDSGLSLLANLKNTVETSHIPVVLLSALADQQSQLKGYQYQANAYLTKPASDAAILACVATQLAQSVRLTQAVRTAIKQERLQAKVNAEKAGAESTAAYKRKKLVESLASTDNISTESSVNSIVNTVLAANYGTADNPEIDKLQTREAQIFNAKLQGVFSSCFNQPNVKVADVAKAFYKSESELQRKCKGHTGESVAALLQKYRYQQACKLLTQHDPQLSIEQVAEQSGFGTVRTMQRTFNLLSGQSPQQYRQQQESRVI